MNIIVRPLKPETTKPLLLTNPIEPTDTEKHEAASGKREQLSAEEIKQLFHEVSEKVFGTRQVA